MVRSQLLSLCFICALSLSSSAHVLTVGGPGSHAQFDNIQAAIDAASAGDKVLLYSGVYEGFVLDKDVDIISDNPLGVLIQETGPDTAAITVRNLPPGADVILGGFEVHGSPTACDFVLLPGGTTPCLATIAIESCMGSVTLGGLTVDAANAAGDQGAPLSIVNSDQVLVIDSLFSSNKTGAYQPGILIAGSVVDIIGCEIQGTSGHIGFLGPDGQEGIFVETSTLTVTRSKVRGGHGTPSTFWGQTPTGPLYVAHPPGRGISALSSSLTLNGGPGASILAGDIACQSFECLHGERGMILSAGSTALIDPSLDLQGGQPCGGVDVPQCASAQGAPFHTNGSSVATYSASIPATLGASSTDGALGGTVVFDVAGEPNGMGALYWTRNLVPPFSIPGFEGLGVLELQTAATLALFQRDQAGVSSVNVAVPAIPALIGAVIYVQAVELQATPYLTNPWMIYIH